MNTNGFLALGALICLLGSTVPAREFSSADGRKIEAEVVMVKGGEVTIRRSDGKDYSLAITLFSPEDQAFLRSWKPAAPASAPPSTPLPTTAGEVKPGSTIRLEFPELSRDRADQTAACQVRLPTNYEPTKPFGLVVWLGGGEGGNQPNGAFVPEGPFVLAGLPYPKGANNPGQANMVGEYDKVWEFHRAMLDRVFQTIPNLKKEWSLIGGFSNGGHSIDGMLRVRDKKGALADYFGAFVIADGGGGYASEKGNYPSLEGKFAYICWGETSPNAANSEGVGKDFKSRRATTVSSEMAKTGHSFADFEQAKVKEWIRTVVMSAWGVE